jgi:vitellogenic carboxypeptidase-like protein
MKMKMEKKDSTTLFINTLIFFSFIQFQNSLSLSDSSTSFPKEALPTKSGYLPVSPKSTSSIFYTFYEAQNSTSPLSQTPLLIWLQGGPGLLLHGWQLL